MTMSRVLLEYFLVVRYVFSLQSHLSRPGLLLTCPGHGRDESGERAVSRERSEVYPIAFLSVVSRFYLGLVLLQTFLLRGLESEPLVYIAHTTMCLRHRAR